MSISELPKDTMSTEGTIADLIGDMTELQKDAAEMLVGAGFPHVAGMSNLAAHPMAAAAAASAIGMGLAGQFFGMMAGTMAGAMKAASMLAEETTGGHPDLGNPMNFDLASGSFDDTKIEDPVTHQPPVKPDKPRKATPAAKAPVKARTPVQARTPVKAEAPTTATRPAKAATAAKTAPAAKAKTTAKAAPKAAAAPKTAKASAPAAKKKTPGAKAAPAAKKASVAKPEPVALSVAPAAPVAAASAIMTEDFRKPKALARPDGPDDLKAISGVGPKLESVLNGLGVWTYGQIAEWTPEEVAWVDDYLSFSGRIGRDGWIAQAAELAKKA